MKRTMSLASLAACLVISLAACGKSKADTKQDVAEEAATSNSDLRAHLQSLKSGGQGKANAALDKTTRPDSLPGDIWLPDDFKVTQVMDMASIGYSLRATSNLNADDLEKGYAAKLASAGYSGVSSKEIMTTTEITFKGKGVNSGLVKIYDADTHREIQISFKPD
ncbi:hypothetical protein HY29_16970 [Hyphomonas beringensis]|uniref:Lipoprotein n=1 Tax=Hyphomonas beringensis TaxID=1280946 RepID=A0A062TZS8_9PROT|nr:hypothetical protein [Hyphomonas beringensis]KCZ53561.1 hypothetical protein HY29_16970 [Hyphomonas beringensis]